MKDSLRKAKFWKLIVMKCLFRFLYCGILSSSKSLLCNDFSRESYKLLLWRLGFTCITAADKLQSFALRFSVFLSVQLRFSFFFLGWFYLECAEICLYFQKCPFLVFFGVIDGNFMEKYSVTPRCVVSQSLNGLLKRNF